MKNYTKKIIIAAFAILGELVFALMVMTLLMIIILGNMAGCKDLAEFINLFFQN